MNAVRSLLVAGLLAGLSLPGPAPAVAGLEQCMGCHGDPRIERRLPGGKTVPLFVDRKEYRESVHGKGDCVACHTDAKVPHGKLAPVACGRCHPDSEKSYSESIHGRDRAQGNRDVPGCAECHGRHGIRKASDPKARTFRLNIVAVCLRCHKDRAIEEKYRIPGRTVMEAYEQSVHAMAMRKSGLLGAAVCPDCHGNHRILPTDMPRSATHRPNIPTLCGKCHSGILETYERSVHGKGMRGGIAESPVCTDCHGEHTITKITDPASMVFARNVPKTCSSCHEKEAISGRYALPKKRLATYMDTFHGIALEYGMTTAANCASCHGFHDILPAADPGSSVHKANLPRTCGKCHPNAGANFAKGSVHVEVTPGKAPGVFAVRLFYTVFITVLVLMFVLHIGMDLVGRRRRKGSKADGGGEG